MKLVDILALELKVWPEKSVAAVQQNSIVYFIDCMDVEFSWGQWDYGEPCMRIHKQKEIHKFERSDDWKTAIVTRAEWQAAVDELNATKVVDLDGDGLPPVGIDCEMKKADSWVLVNILAHIVDDPIFNPIAIYMEANDPSALAGQAVASRFRSIRTAEQVAAEEREKAVADLYFTINWSEGRETWPFISNGLKADYEKAIDAGWQKVAP